MPLNDTMIRHLKPKPAAYKVADEKGLFLLVTPTGGKLWRLKLRNSMGVEKKLALGAYPDLKLKDAREARDKARSGLAKGIDPAEQKQSDKRAAKINAANTFSVVAKAYIEKNRRDGKAEATVKKREWFLGLVDRSIGQRPIADIQPYEILKAVRLYKAAKNHEKSHRTLQFVGQVFRFAVANQIAPRDPTRDLRGALIKRQPKHHAAILEPKLVGDLLRAVDGYEGQGIPVTRIALQLSPHVFVRPGELRSAEWKEVDLEGAVWRIPAARMKGRQEHVVPLSRQVKALLGKRA